MQRIASRDRSYERNMEIGYIDQLNHAYEEFFSSPIEGSSVLVIDTNPLDFVRNPEHLKNIENRIRESLRMAPFQSELPLGEAGVG